VKVKQLYSYKASVKSAVSDELINTFFIRPIAGLIVGALYYTSVLPIQIVMIGTLFGGLSAVSYLSNMPSLGALLLATKNLLDAADGQLARAKNLADRRGRFLDSISDFFVNLMVFSAITYTLCQSHPLTSTVLLGIVALFGLTFRVSYFVYYQASYLRLEDRIKVNRLIETVTEEDRRGDELSLRLQQIFIVIYNWQDWLVHYIDGFCRSRIDQLSEDKKRQILREWYSDRLALRLTSFLGLGTELTILIAMSLANELHLYLIVNAVVLNGYMLTVVSFRKFILQKVVMSKSGEMEIQEN
jgi:phosphatidylglycerophosphate synthase